MSDIEHPQAPIVRPKASRTTRPISLRSKASFRGCRVGARDDREVFHESSLEDALGLILEADRSVERYEEQPPAVTYVDDDGSPHKHTFDIRATLRCGTRIAYAVKASKRVEPTRTRRILELIEEQVGTRFADEYVPVTERDLPRSRVANAVLTIHARSVRDPAEMQELVRFVDRVRGSLSISSLLDASGIGLGGFTSAVNLLDEGLIRQVSPGRIDAETLVRPSPRTH